MTFDDCSYQLVIYNATTGKEIGRATVLDTHSLKVTLEDIGSFVLVRRALARWVGLMS
jgi:hypothetical protein